MSERATPRVAVIADTSLQRHVLQQALLGHGYEVVLNADPARVDDAALECAPDLWLVDLTQQDDSPLLDSLLEQDRAPVLFGEGHAPERHTEHYPRWERRLIGKLKRLIGDPSDGVGDSLGALLDEERPPRLEIPATSRRCRCRPAKRPARWLLAASLGGPAAVKAFLDALPGGLPIGFLYAQHIDASFEQNLPQAVGRHSQWHVKNVRDGEALRCGEVMVVPVLHELGFHHDGRLKCSQRPWPEPYTPSIDQMMLNLAQQFGPDCGVIVFSGMGSDGSAAAACGGARVARYGPSAPTVASVRACRTACAKPVTAVSMPAPRTGRGIGQASGRTLRADRSRNMNQAVIEQDGMSRNTPANPTPDSLTGLLLPLSDRTLLLPNVAVAELIAYRNPQVAAGVPQWYLGQVAWRDLRLPLLSFEAASSGEQQPVLGSSARVVVINALGGRPHVKFLALLVQGIPRSVRLDANLASTAAGGAGTGGGGHRRRNRADSGPGRARRSSPTPA